MTMTLKICAQELVANLESAVIAYFRQIQQLEEFRKITKRSRERFWTMKSSSKSWLWKREGIDADNDKIDREFEDARKRSFDSHGNIRDYTTTRYDVHDSLRHLYAFECARETADAIALLFRNMALNRLSTEYRPMPRMTPEYLSSGRDPFDFTSKKAFESRMEDIRSRTEAFSKQHKEYFAEIEQDQKKRQDEASLLLIEALRLAKSFLDSFPNDPTLEENQAL
ncbi:MAG: hypothetical protein ABJA67_09430 [Chthonomonadales bacterium]